MAYWRYNLSEDETHYFLTIEDADPQSLIVDLELPATHEGLPVTGAYYFIGSGSYDTQSEIKTIKIPRSYKSVYFRAGLFNLEKIYYDGLDTFEKIAKDHLFPLTDYPSDYNRYYEALPNYKMFLSLNPTSENELLDIELEGDEVSSYMFHKIENIRSVSGVNVTDIFERSFYGCAALESVYFPKADWIGYYNYAPHGGVDAFSHCPYLEKAQFCNKETIALDERVNTFDLGNFAGSSTEVVKLKLVLPRIKQYIDSGFSQNLAIFSARKSTDAPLIVESENIPSLEIYYFGGDEQEPTPGEWIFAADGRTVLLRQEASTQLEFSLQVPLMTSEQSLAARFGDIGRYQTNKYYFAGTFDYMIRGSINSSDSQPIKGNIMHLRSLEIKYFDDRIGIDHDDLVVIDGHLYGVEELTYDIKRMPKPYTVYFATLNNIK